MSDSSAPDPLGEVHLRVGGRVAEVVMSRPSRRNALSVEMCGRLASALRAAADDPEVRVVLLYGDGPVFCAGADFGDFDSGPERGGFVPAFHDLLATIAHLRVPVVAYINGHALGAGCQIAAQCDLRLASASATFGVPAAKVGICVDMPNTTRMICELGPSLARRLLLTGDPLTADEALRAGMIHRVEADDVAAAAARAWAEHVGGRAPLSVQGHKAAIQAVVDGWHLDAALPAFMECEQRSLAAFASEDLREGLRAFGEKRTPDFHGR